MENEENSVNGVKEKTRVLSGKREYYGDFRRNLMENEGKIRHFPLKSRSFR